MQQSMLKEHGLQESTPLSTFINRRIGLVSTGNWCGHTPDAPRFFKAPSEHKARPLILTWAAEACQKFYASPASRFKSVKDSRRSKRQQRSESREAMASIAQVILHYTELASLRVGFPNASGEFISLTVEFLAKKAGIGFKRAQRALEVMKRAGYIKIIERFDIKNEQFIGLAAVKSLTITFMKACGINLQVLSAQRSLARKRIDKKRNQEKVSRQEQSVTTNVLDFIIPQGSSKAYVDSMRAILGVDNGRQVKEREKEIDRRQSLEKTRE